MKAVRKTAWTAVVVILIGVMLCACGDSKTGKGEQAKSVELKTIVLEPAVDSYVAIEAEKYQEIKATLEARLDGAGIEDFSVEADAGKGRVTVSFPKESADLVTEDLLTGIGLAELFDPEGVPRMNSNDIASAEGIMNALENGGTEYAVLIRFSDEGSQKLDEVTREIVRKWNGMDLSLYMDDSYFGSKAINDPITDGNVQITVEGTADDLDRLVNMINAGPMPFPMQIVEFGGE